MTDKQLAILIRSWANALKREIDYLKEQLPEQFKDKEEIAGFSLETFPVLGGLSNLLEEMREADETLTGMAEEKRQQQSFVDQFGSQWRFVS